MIATIGIGATVDLRASGSGDSGLSADAARFVAEAEALLPPPEPTDDWYVAAQTLYVWTAMRAIRDSGAALAPIALRVGEMMEGMLVSLGGKDGPARPARSPPS